jgi:hypothetical protein
MPLWHHMWIIVTLYWLAYLNIKFNEFREYLQVNYVKRSSFDFVTHLEFSSLALLIWKTLCKSLEGICNVPIDCCNIPIQTNYDLNFPNFLFEFPNFLFCSERCYWSIIFVSQLQRPEQNRKLGICNRKLRTSNRNWGKFSWLLATLQISSRDLQGSFLNCRSNEENCNQFRNSKEERFT